MRILHLASEIAPYSKTGGLADVLGALPNALARLGAEVIVVAPRYGSVSPERFGLARWLRTIPVPVGPHRVEVGLYDGQLPGGGKARVLLVDHPASFERERLYGYDDDARRFTILGRAALATAAHFGLWPDVVHGHDWQAGPALLYAHASGGDLVPPKLVLTVHNLAFQGLFPPSVIDEVGLPRELFQPDGFEFYGQVSLLKAGLVVADAITTVSPTYALEIQTPEHGAGLEGLLKARSGRLAGILNGVDYHVWSPERDPHLARPYGHDDLSGKRACKQALQAEVGLPLRAETPLCGMISRLTEQKGLDLVVAALPAILEEDVQVVVLGTGEPGFERALSELAARYPKKLAVRVAYDDPLAHRIEAGADLFVMPSRFEPCGLSQLYSLRYGTPPIVRATGGLEDTIVDYEPRSRSGTGFKFGPYTVAALLEAWRRALKAYRDTPDDFVALQKRGMSMDFSWEASARRYLALYDRILGL